jgi:hypothetical protein
MQMPVDFDFSFCFQFSPVDNASAGSSGVPPESGAEERKVHIYTE